MYAYMCCNLGVQSSVEKVVYPWRRSVVQCPSPLGSFEALETFAASLGVWDFGLLAWGLCVSSRCSESVQCQKASMRAGPCVARNIPEALDTNQEGAAILLHSLQLEGELVTPLSSGVLEMQPTPGTWKEDEVCSLSLYPFLFLGGGGLCPFLALGLHDRQLSSSFGCW